MYNVTTHNQDDSIDINGTHLQGTIVATYAELVGLFGEPTEGDAYKVDAEWDIEFYDEEEGDRVVATIYNWKNGLNYCGNQGYNTEDITEWHIGGKSSQASFLVGEFIEAFRQKRLAPPEAVLVIPYKK